MNWFSKIHELAGQEYERYLPTAFDGSLTLLEKVNKVIETLNQIVLGVNTVADYVDEQVNTQNEKIKQLRDDFEILKYWLENEGLEERTKQVLNEWFDNGRLAQIINDVFDMKVDKVTFEQFVLSINQQLQQTVKVVNIEKYVVGDGITVDTAGLREAVSVALASKAKLYGPPYLTVLIDDTVDMFGIRYAEIESDILHTNTGIGIIAGYNSGTVDASNYYFKRVQKQGTMSDLDISIQFSGLKNSHVNVQHVDKMELFADASIPEKASIAYSNFNLTKVRKLTLNGVTESSWINENVFIGGRYALIELIGLYPHNENVFVKPCVEQGVIDIQSGSRNIFENVRTEGGTQIKFSENTHHNYVSEAYVNTSVDLKGMSVITDLGNENVVESIVEKMHDRVTIHELNGSTAFYNEGQISEQRFLTQNIVKGLNGFQGSSGTFQEITVPVDIVKRFEFYANINKFALWITPLDVNKKEVDGAVYPNQLYNYGGNLSRSGNEYRTAQTYANHRILVVGKETHYLKIKIRLTVTSLTVFEWFKIDALIKKGKSTAINQIQEFVKKSVSKQVSSDTIPVKSIARVDDIIFKPTGYYKCTKEVNQLTTDVANIGDTFIVVGSVSAINTGDLLAIEKIDGTTFFTTVESKVSAEGRLNLTTALDGSVTIGAKVLANAWV